MFCSKCGAQLDEEDRYCPRCGTPVKSAERAGETEQKEQKEKEETAVREEEPTDSLEEPQIYREEELPDAPEYGTDEMAGGEPVLYSEVYRNWQPPEEGDRGRRNHRAREDRNSEETYKQEKRSEGEFEDNPFRDLYPDEPEEKSHVVLMMTAVFLVIAVAAVMFSVGFFLSRRNALTSETGSAVTVESVLPGGEDSSEVQSEAAEGGTTDDQSQEAQGQTNA